MIIAIFGVHCLVYYCTVNCLLKRSVNHFTANTFHKFNSYFFRAPKKPLIFILHEYYNNMLHFPHVIQKI